MTDIEREDTPTQPSPIAGEGFQLHVPPPRWGRLGKGALAAALMKIALVLAMALAAGTAAAVEPDEMLKDPAQEARAEAIGRQLRCPVCKTESIEESDADFTKDLRKVVREQVAAGKTDTQVLDFMHDRYGDFILLRPPFKSTTWALWLGPPILLVLGGLFAFFMTRRRPATVEPAPLTPDEQAAVEALK
jgi:cytochrome c-type biogenesis protein CcmH